MNVVAIGGGTGLSTVLRGLKQYLSDQGSSNLPARHSATRPVAPLIRRLTAVVTVTDEGGSSGRLRRDFRVLPPGDIRNCLVALAEDETLFTQLFNYRFPSGRGLRGHSFGNLFLTALTNLTQDFTRAVRVSSEVLAIRGEIFPATLSDVHLKARLRDGRIIEGESRITKTHVPIERLFTVPSRCHPLAETLAAIREADLITVGPGSLFTSLIPNLLVEGISREIALSRATKVYVSNLMTQPGETMRLSASDHLKALHKHARRPLFDWIVLNTQPLPAALREKYAASRSERVVVDLEKILAMGVRPVCADLLAEDDVVRHHPGRLAHLILRLAERRQPRAALRRSAPVAVATS